MKTWDMTNGDLRSEMLRIGAVMVPSAEEKSNLLEIVREVTLRENSYSVKEFDRFELMDRASTLQTMHAELVDGHKGIDSDELKKANKKVRKALWNLYSLASNASLS